jgi:hypothetical protein
LEAIFMLMVLMATGFFSEVHITRIAEAATLAIVAVLGAIPVGLSWLTLIALREIRELREGQVANGKKLDELSHRRRARSTDEGSLDSNNLHGLRSENMARYNQTPADSPQLERDAPPVPWPDPTRPAEGGTTSGDFMRDVF